MTAKMKPSGVPYIAYVPTEWEVKPLKYCVDINKEVLLESTNPNYLFRYVDIGSVTYVDGITGYEDFTFENAPSRARRIVHSGDTIVSTVRTYLKAITRIRDDKDVIVSTGFAVLSPTSINPIFLEYFCKSEVFEEEVDKQSSGIAYPAVSAAQIGRIYMPLPPLPEQHTIAAFLDDRCGQVDGIISDLTRQVEILRQYKKALITETVTKGLDKNAPMKRVNMDITDAIPAHWKETKIKFLCKMQSGDSITSEVITEDGDYPVYGGNGFRGYYEQYNTEGDSILVGRQGALCGNVHMVKGRFWASDHAVVTSPYPDVLRLFLYYLLIAMNLNQYSQAAAQPGLAVVTIQRQKAGIPPTVGEQKNIADYLDRKCAEVDALIAEKERSIETMRQYKKSLIYEYVTGKKRVSVGGTRG
jgi:type I restriction enzyme S subunit